MDYAKPDKDEHGEWERARLLVCNLSGQDMRLRDARRKVKGIQTGYAILF